jgi:exodeoxyribonuclease V beta subunit
VLGTAIAGDVEALLEAALMPGDSSAVRRAMLTPLLGVSPRALSAMDDAVWSNWMTSFRDWNETWHAHGVVRFLEDVLRASGAETRIGALPTARRQLTDLLHIEELLLRGEREKQRDPVALMMWFRRLRQGSPEDTMVAQEDLQQRPDAESNTVRVTTIHKSKGLQYEIVYCPFPWNDAKLFDFDRRVVRFHDPDDHFRPKLDLGSSQRETNLTLSQRESLSEALRLLYVATTRAKHRCTLFWGRSRGWERSALGYLLHGAEPPKPMEDDGMRADLDALAKASAGSIGWRHPIRGPIAPRQSRDEPPPLRARLATRILSQANRIASFTSLSGHHEKTEPRDRTRDSILAPDALFSYLPGGARTGLLLHAILEQADLGDMARREAETLVASELERFGYDPSLSVRLAGDLRRVVSTPLFDDPNGPALRSIARDRQLRELAFTLRVDEPDFDRLVTILQTHETPRGAPDYPSRLAAQSKRSLKSFLRGFIDLVFEWEGRWYVADYKSSSLPRYELADITEAAADSHYFLQMQLYAAATNRHLSQRIAGYDPARHWGGVILLFIRGMKGAKAPGAGVYHERQQPELLHDLDHWLGGGA